MKFIFTFLILLLSYIVLIFYYKDGFSSLGFLVIIASSLISYFIDKKNN